ncbi:YggS family pyridoxal phosphate enzyme [Anoxybacter fermentans]|uniref:Pyridoxal phosphate homeostasis protein n=1 Tax=Anoxybacter fermentans TaxID=1323375 RepID=A0A3Q9HQB4_9FIRM|nr:YggS family pyridoxal phosphate-dependent enzyme [Anoxybacter fermentans]AZR73022.1 YggS family pyridoxal phosphate enzyme [Anoxybacter fermentans]
MGLLERLADVQRRIRLAAERVNRNPEEIKLIPVSKYHSIEKIQTLLKAGIYDFGESRVQELREKQSQLPKDVNWHLIGHLQRNKVKYVVRMPNCKLIHSVDNLRLVQEIQRRCELEDTTMDILVQVNVANDDAKFGILSGEALEFVKKVAEFDRVKVKGLMTIVPEVDDPEEVRPYFRRLKELSEEIRKAAIPGVEMAELSMGMTNDFEVAIEEGATMVRIGSAIFGPRK